MELVVIQASHYRQACEVAKQLGLGKPNEATVGAHTQVVFWHRPEHVRGTPTRVIFAEPRLESSIIDRLFHDDTRFRLRTRAKLQGIKVESVTT